LRIIAFPLAILFLFLQVKPATAAELFVSSAISLREAFLQIGASFERKHPGDKVIFNFAASGELALQIERSAPADVFVSASNTEMSRLQSKQLIAAGSVKAFAGNRLVLIVPSGGKRINSLQQLTTLESLAIGNPATVPAGKYAAEALKRANVYSQLVSGKKLILSESVRQALVYVQSGNVDAGIVYATDGLAGKKVDIALIIPDNLHEPIVYPIALLRDSKQVELGRAFIDLVTSLEGRSILKSKGFLPLQ
jgi:molybdate transport system substrate-binding protein